ncbi:histidine kinase [Streptosporangium sp. NPDC051023]|uniref:sensor histidine kinase n=1 Tax=Streptosporangium sp. NPDC051023 TaxID=3155410 RepID=UPI00344C914B
MRERLTRAVRSCGYLLTGLGCGLATLVLLPAAALPGGTARLRRWTGWNRRRAAALLCLPDPGPRDGRLLPWSLEFALTGMITGFATFIAAGRVAVVPVWWLYPEDRPVVLLAPVDSWGSALGYGALGLVFLCWAGPPLAHALARRCLSGPTEREWLAERVMELGESRAAVVDAHGAELRRIERDLHDGAQARLVAIAIRLGVAREALGENDPVAQLLREAHEGAQEAMVELREVIRTMYPPVLVDRGLGGALAALAARCDVPVHLDDSVRGPLPAAIEAAAYFIVAEALTNVSKHSRAGRADVRLARERGVLLVEVADDGVGGVDETRGTGVIGIRRRAAALDGTVSVTGPPNGPTRIVVRLPCAS